MPETNQPAAEVQTPTPAPVETPAATTPVSAEELFAARRAGASPDQISAMESRLLTSKPEAEPPKPVDAEPAKPEPATPAASADEDEEPEVETPPGEQPKAEDTKAPRVRIHDPLDQAFQALRKAGKTPDEAFKAVYGGTKAAEAEQPEPEIPAAVKAIDDEIASHEATLTQIAEDRRAYISDPSTFADELADLDKQRDQALAAIAKASGKRSSVEQTELREQDTVASAQEARKQALVNAVKVYPDLGDKKTALWAVTAAVANEIRDPAHPDHAKSFEPNAIDYCAAEAAKRLGVKPATAAPVAKVETPLTPKPPGPARGSLATAQPAAPVSSEAAKKAAETQFLNRRNQGATTSQTGLLSH